jgi:hypothetical protein
MRVTKEYIESLPKLIDPITGCWLYQGHINSKGYGVVVINYRAYRISRLTAGAYYDLDYFNYSIDTCHKVGCPNRSCFNPEHLYLGTRAQNIQDSVAEKTHHESAKVDCSHCGRPLTLKITKSGPNKGKRSRYCKWCVNWNRNTKKGYNR